MEFKELNLKRCADEMEVVGMYDAQLFVYSTGF